MKNTFNNIFPSWTKWVFFIFSFLFICAVIYAFTLYFQITHKKEENFSLSESIILQKTDLVAIDEVTRFHGETYYHVITGKDQENQVFYAFLPQSKTDENNEITLINHANILNVDSVKKSWKSACPSCQFKDMIPGLIEDEPVWEIKYLDEKGNYVFDYVSMYDGSSIETFRLKQFYTTYY